MDRYVLMINKEKNPVEWAMLMYELEEVQEHLANLISDLDSDPEYDEINLRIDLGHIYSHLNRVWHCRHLTKELSDTEWELASQFPTDLEPV
jgi:hypothetical protein